MKTDIGASDGPPPDHAVKRAVKNTQTYKQILSNKSKNEYIVGTFLMN